MSNAGKTGTAPMWGGVVAMALCASVLISSEFLPVSLLTPIATDLHITEGHAGQSISVSGFFAVLTSLFISTIIGASDRKNVVLTFTGLMIVSGIMVAAAPSAAVLMIGRALLGISIGGFWSISAAIMMRLVPEESVPKALAILNGGNAVASTLAAPIGSFLGSLIGWRGAFFVVVPIAAISFIWQWRSLPSLPPTKDALRVKDAFALLRHRQFALGMSGVGLFFLGQFALFTYLRPYLDVVTHGDAPLLSGILLATGAAGAVGTFCIGNVLKRSLYAILFAFPIAMSAVAILLISVGTSPLSAGSLLVVWGLLGTSAPVAWWTWLSRTMPHEAEAGGGMMVAVIQIAITLGAVVGGILFDAWGFESTFGFAAATLIPAAIVAVLTHQAGIATPKSAAA